MSDYNYKDVYEQWVNNPLFGQETKDELLAIKDDEKEIEERFYCDLVFGTAGLRGIIGAGTNRMNIYVVRKATQGLANYIIKAGKQDKGVAIAYDSRRMSPEFSMEAALCLAANGIKAYRFESLRPTPELSFAVRYLDCVAGINVTASHNPPEYNGYKVYWEDGAQITPPHDQGIMAEVKAITDFADTKTMDMVEAKKKGLLVTIGSEVDDAYMGELKKLILNQDAIDKYGKDIKIVYTPLHGTGNIPVRRILKEIGFENVYVVPEQELPDGDFPTVEYPNPEDPKAFELALKLAKEKNADIVLATDPDADRLGIYALDTKTGKYMPFTGNMSGLIIAEYQFRERTKCGLMPKNPAMVKTIVTTNMADPLAADYNVNLIEVLTGFKFIGEQIKFFEQNNSYNFVMGMEESYGCLVGTYARDKDAPVAVMCLCEAAAYCKSQGITLWDHMLDLYEKYGYYKEGLYTITLKGVTGAEKIRKIMSSLRAESLTQIDTLKVLKVRDYEKNTITDLATGEVTESGLPQSNVLYYDLEDGAWACVRPSGTEPKIKLYYGIKGTSLDDADAKLEALQTALVEKLNKLAE